MFKINFRVTDSIEKLQTFSQEEIATGKPIEGYFEIEVNDKKYGYCNMETLHSNESGMDLLTTWFEGLIQLITELKRGCTYIAISDIESINSWIEFKRLDQTHISISSLEAKKWAGVGQIVVTPLHNIEHYDWTNEIVTYDEIFQEIKQKTFDYIAQVNKINPAIAQGKCFLALKEKIDKLNNI
ncbi:MAG: hypothetical protein WC365_05530 [Candidatus Babeliales bacterium]|jgi:hypothetical protein